MRILVLNGPNLNLLGRREPKHYGKQSLSDIVAKMKHQAETKGVDLLHSQRNAEHLLLEDIHQAMGNTDLIIFNPAAFSHTSIALRDALLATGVPFILLHISQVKRRESFRQTCYFADIALGVIEGFGPQSYFIALDAAIHCLQNQLLTQKCESA